MKTLYARVRDYTHSAKLWKISTQLCIVKTWLMPVSKPCSTNGKMVCILMSPTQVMTKKTASAPCTQRRHFFLRIMWHVLFVFLRNGIFEHDLHGLSTTTKSPSSFYLSTAKITANPRCWHRTKSIHKNWT